MGDEPLKRFLLFRWDGYYPSGGFQDLVGSYDTKNEAIATYREGGYYDFAEVFDCDLRQIVWRRDWTGLNNIDG